MSEPPDARDVVEQYVGQGGDDKPLVLVQRTAALQREVDVRLRDAVGKASESHSWSEIGAALGVSKQAAHRKYVTALAEDIKTQHQAMKRARRAGKPAEAGAALSSLLEKAETIKKVSHRS